MSDAVPEASGVPAAASADPTAGQASASRESGASPELASSTAVEAANSDVNDANTSSASAHVAFSPLVAGAEAAQTPPDPETPVGLPEGASLLRKTSAYMNAATRERSGRKINFADQVRNVECY
jgi:hypothetical protein